MALVFPLVFPIATYGCESWTLRKNEIKKSHVFEHWCWRRMLRLPWTSRRINVSIIEQVGRQIPLETTITKQKLSYFGHIVRSTGLEKAVMLGMQGQRKRRKPRRSWFNDVQDITGLSLQEAKEVARDCCKWRQKVMEVTRGRLRTNGTKQDSWHVFICSTLYKHLGLHELCSAMTLI